MFKKVLIANRGEIAIRISRALAELEIESVAIYSDDDNNSRHWQFADQAFPLEGKGARAYLDGQQIIMLANLNQCDAIHPGYGFLSEDAAFAQQCLDANIIFIGPKPDTLATFGNKISARQLAKQCNVPVLESNIDAGANDKQNGNSQKNTTTAADVKSFFNQHGGAPIVIKAAAGGGGRGMAIVSNEMEIDSAFARCQSEAEKAFGNGELYVESFIESARHIEVQIIADNSGSITHLWERECSAQRRQQKIIEIAPSPTLSDDLRNSIINSALTLAKHGNYNNIGTFEFLVNTKNNQHVFIETNPRLQVEHTVTESVTGVDIVQTQIQLAANKTLQALQISTPPSVNGMALQLRLNAERYENGQIKPSNGSLTEWEAPSGPGVRVDTFAHTGFQPNPNFDSLIAKIICHSENGLFSSLINKSKRALKETLVSGMATNRDLLMNLLDSKELKDGTLDTRHIDKNLEKLNTPRSDFFTSGEQQNATSTLSQRADIPEHLQALPSPLQGTLFDYLVKQDDLVFEGQDVAIIESMKMEHVIQAPCSGKIAVLFCEPSDTLFENTPLLAIDPQSIEKPEDESTDNTDPIYIRPDLQEVIDRHGFGFDENRPDAVARRRKTKQRTARENISDLVDEGSFIEYGPLVVAAQRARRSEQELIEKTPGDGLVGGMGRVNGQLFSDKASQVVAVTYDYTVLAGTQGQKNHRKKDRLFELAEQWQLPVVLFAEGGGGRPGETERNSASGLNCLAFYYFAKLKGLCPLVSIVSGRCFAGNAVLLGCSDVIIATKNTNIGMGGPAMIEGGGLGVYKPEEVGPVEDHTKNGVIDVLVDDEEEAVAAAKKYLGYFQGRIQKWQCADQHLLRTVIPENRLRVYDVRKVINLLADSDSVLELRKEFGLGMVTVFARIEGRPVGIVANNPIHLGGAIDSEGSDKAARFIQTCNAFSIPIVFLCDTPGIMVGPEAEKTALVRHTARLFIAGAAAKVPFFTVVLRKAYGLGAQTMAGGSFHASFFTVSWPTGEFGGMGLEGAVRLGYRNEIAAIEDPEEKEKYFQEQVDKMYQLGKATSVAQYFDLDDVIDPKDTRQWIVRGLESTDGKSNHHRADKPYIDTW